MVVHGFILAHGRQADPSEFKFLDSYGYMESPCFKKKNEMNK